MENSRRSIAPNEDSISMYLSFDADDTLASKWQSVMVSQTSQYLEARSIEMDPKLDETLEDKANKDKKSVLKALIKNENTANQISPLRPFDQSLLNKHNAHCSTPTKNVIKDDRQNLTASDHLNKENSPPDVENSTLSSTIDATASTVKTNTMFNVGNATIDEISVQESSNKTNVYPLNADVLLENITEVSNEEPSISMPSSSPTAAEAPEEKKETNFVVSEMVDEVSELIAKALKLTESPRKPKEESKQASKVPLVNLPRPRRSYLPTANMGGAMFKQRMSIVVKTTLNSPARKLVTSQSNARRSCLPAPKSNFTGGALGPRKSILPRSSLTPSNRIAAQTTSASAGKSIAKSKPKETTDVKYNCKLCSANFRAKYQLDLHMGSHLEGDTLPARTLKTSNSCKFCDKKFALERALHIHLMQNCDKIPPSEKRKLQYTELNHVTKAQLPKLIPGSASVNNCALSKPRESIMPAIDKAPPAPIHKEVIKVTKTVQMAPPSVAKVPKTAHAGVYRTPTKSVPCHICGLSFKSILAYTNHCLTVHSKNQEQE